MCNLTTQQLKACLRAAGLSVSGRKGALVARLLAADSVCDEAELAGDAPEVAGDGATEVSSGSAAQATPRVLRPRVTWGVAESSEHSWDTSADTSDFSDQGP